MSLQAGMLESLWLSCTQVLAVLAGDQAITFFKETSPDVEALGEGENEAEWIVDITTNVRANPLPQSSCNTAFCAGSPLLLLHCNGQCMAPAGDAKHGVQLATCVFV